MTDRPILFSAPMILALLAGRKFQTRRLVKIGGAGGEILEFVEVGTDKETGRSVYEMKGHGGVTVAIAAGKHLATPHYMPPIAVGDRLWVKEAWRTQEAFDADSLSEICAEFESEWGTPSIPTFYEADKKCDDHSVELWQQSKPGRLRASMHMPRCASRLTLIVEDVKIERLQDISEEDAEAEGLHETSLGRWHWEPTEPEEFRWLCARDAYRSLWERINGAGSWASNPWVYATSFRVIPQNIDQIARAA
jgi:hypothetical protein